MIQLDEINWNYLPVMQARLDMFTALIGLEKEIPNSPKQWCQAMNRWFDIKVIAFVIGHRNIEAELIPEILIDLRIIKIVVQFKDAILANPRVTDPLLMNMIDLTKAEQRQIVIWIDKNMDLKCSATMGVRFGKKGLMFNTTSLRRITETSIRCNQCNKVIYDEHSTNDPYLLIWLHIQQKHLTDILAPLKIMQPTSEGDLSNVSNNS